MLYGYYISTLKQQQTSKKTSPLAPDDTVLVFCGCHNKLPQTEWVETMQMIGSHACVLVIQSCPTLWLHGL